MAAAAAAAAAAALRSFPPPPPSSSQLRFFLSLSLSYNAAASSTLCTQIFHFDFKRNSRDILRQLQ